MHMWILHNNWGFNNTNVRTPKLPANELWAQQCFGCNAAALHLPHCISCLLASNRPRIAAILLGGGGGGGRSIKLMHRRPPDQAVFEFGIPPGGCGWVRAELPPGGLVGGLGASPRGLQQMPADADLFVTEQLLPMKLLCFPCP